jgi:uncharacterized protein YprB with RNaseH-like and TPR domain
LRYILYSLGFKGGLKGCERQLEMDRGDLSDIDGFFAVLLWEEYQKTGDPKALETLLSYNVQDTINLEALMLAGYNMKLKETSFYDSHWTEQPEPSTNPFRVDLATVDKIKNSSQYRLSDQWY